mgnify:FL=1
MTNSVNSFEKEFKYKLYRTVYEVVHPTISKKNISSYRIMFKDDILPVRVFYPKKVSNINRIIFYIAGFGNITGCTGKYSDICKKLAIKTDTLVIAIDMDDIDDDNYLEVYELCHKTCLYLNEELEKLNIDDLKIFLTGDSLGANIAMSICKDEKFSLYNMILFYPVLSSKCLEREIDYEVLKSLKRYFSDKKLLSNSLVFPLLDMDYKYKNNTLFIVGDADPIKDDGVNYYNLSHDNNKNNELYVVNMYGHGFLDGIDDIAFGNLFDKVNEFMNNC